MLVDIIAERRDESGNAAAHRRARHFGAGGTVGAIPSLEVRRAAFDFSSVVARCGRRCCAAAGGDRSGGGGVAPAPISRTRGDVAHADPRLRLPRQPVPGQRDEVGGRRGDRRRRVARVRVRGRDGGLSPTSRSPRPRARVSSSSLDPTSRANGPRPRRRTSTGRRTARPWPTWCSPRSAERTPSRCVARATAGPTSSSTSRATSRSSPADPRQRPRRGEVVDDLMMPRLDSAAASCTSVQRMVTRW